MVFESGALSGGDVEDGSGGGGGRKEGWLFNETGGEDNRGGV